MRRVSTAAPGLLVTIALSMVTSVFARSDEPASVACGCACGTECGGTCCCDKKADRTTEDPDLAAPSSLKGDSCRSTDGAGLPGSPCGSTVQSQERATIAFPPDHDGILGPRDSIGLEDSGAPPPHVSNELLDPPR
jgi:hypothetical protein